MENESVFHDNKSSNEIDVNENSILREDPELLNLLLKDRTTKKNIIWATTSYEILGEKYQCHAQIKPELITGKQVSIIRPRVEKAEKEKKVRTKVRAEVFTPTWIVSKQNEIADSSFKELPLEDYISKVWLEITCGEAPYIVSRYDTVSGEAIKICDRVGFLDKKLQRVNKEVNSEKQWIELVKKSYKSSFGYEFQGDSLLLARENLLFTFIDYYREKFGKEPNIELKKMIASIISYNIFQMDGLKYIIPYSEKPIKSERVLQLSLFAEFEEHNQIELDLVLQGILVEIKNWKRNKMITFESLIMEGR